MIRLVSGNDEQLVSIAGSIADVFSRWSEKQDSIWETVLTTFHGTGVIQNLLKAEISIAEANHIGAAKSCI